MRIVWKLLHRRRSFLPSSSFFPLNLYHPFFVIGNLDCNLPINLNEKGSPKMVMWNAKEFLSPIIYLLFGSVLRFLGEILDFDANWSNGRFAINPSVYTLCSHYEILLYVIYPARLRRNKWYFESNISVNLIRTQFCSRDVPQDFPTFRWLCSWQSHTYGHFIKIWKK